jgi:hypothetical protein
MTWTSLISQDQPSKYSLFNPQQLTKITNP